jgi:hypothetical protein
MFGHRQALLSADKRVSPSPTPAKWRTGMHWEQVEERVAELARDAVSLSRATALDRDPARTDILDHC